MDSSVKSYGVRRHFAPFSTFLHEGLSVGYDNCPDNICKGTWSTSISKHFNRENASEWTQGRGSWACNRMNGRQDDGQPWKSSLCWSELGLFSLGLCWQALNCVGFVIVYCAGLLVPGFNTWCWLETYLRNFPFHLRHRVPSGEPIKDSLQH